MNRLTRLPSGMTVVSFAMPGLETAAIGLFAPAGSRHEREEVNGLAHLFEHMVFKGAGGRNARALSEAIEDVGGELNAYTERDATSFTAAVLAEYVPLAVELLSDLVCRPHFDAADLTREAEVVLQELAEAEDTPSDIIFDRLWSAAFADQPLGRSILGSEDSVRAIRVDDLHHWRRTHYASGGLILAAAGKVDHAALVALAEQRFACVDLAASPAPEPALFTPTHVRGPAKADQAQLTLGWEAPAIRDPAFFAARAFVDIAGGGTSSRLFQAVREERGLAYTVSAGLHPHDEIGLLYVHAATSRKQGAAAQALIVETMHACAETLEQRELDRVRTQARAALAMSLETPWGRASHLARQLQVHGRLLEPGETEARLAALTVDEVRAAGAALLARPHAEATLGLAA